MPLLRRFPRLPSAPLVLLLAGLTTVFVFGHDQRGGFYRPGHHDYVSAEHLSIAVNLSPAHRFLMFTLLRDVEDGTARSRYTMYNRFPIGGYALTALVTSPFRDDLSARLRAARLLMLGFFAATAVLAYLALSRLTASRWVALTAVLLAFSSYYALYYSDMIIFHALSVGGFGVSLTFHGLVVFLQDGRFRQLLVKTCAALLLDWTVLALVAAFVVLASARHLLRAPLSGQLPRPRHCVILGGLSLLLFAALLTFNLVLEHAAEGGERAWRDLRTVKSLSYRTGFDTEFNERYADELAWPGFLAEQFRRIGTLSTPYALLPGGTPHRPLRRDGREAKPDGGRRALAVGVVMSAATLAVLPFVRGRLACAALVLMGFCWSLPMRNSAAFHDYFSVFYVGIPLVVFAAGAAGLRRRAGDRAVVGLSVAALALFVLSSHRMSGVGVDAETAETRDALMSDFETIRRMTAGHPVYVPVWKVDPEFAGSPRALSYYLSGSILYERFNRRVRPCHPGFVVSRARVTGADLLTPHNRLAFLYDRGDYDRHTRLADSGPPAAPRARTDCSHLGRPSTPADRLDPEKRSR